MPRPSRAHCAFATLTGLLLLAGPLHAPAGAAGPVTGCGAVASRVQAVPGDGPAFLESHEGAADPALRGAAFTYDNALATIALVACGDVPAARRIGDALLAAATRDRAGPVGPEGPGRLRNAYRAGPVTDVPLPPGWWDGGQNRWLEDAYLVGTATGNVAWAALALLTLAEATGDADYLHGAERLLGWVVRSTEGPGGFTGGIHSFETAPVTLTWTSTEHAVDLAAAFAWMDRRMPGGPWAKYAAKARSFLDRMYDADEGRFLAGLAPDGTPNRDSYLDAQLWPLLLADADPRWSRALDWVQARHGVAGGYDFNADRDGMWVEGTAQAALTLRQRGRAGEAMRLLEGLDAVPTADGYLPATTADRLSTGLAIGPDSTGADFFYYPKPHLGATAWTVLARTGWNPFTGRRLGGLAD